MSISLEQRFGIAKLPEEMPTYVVWDWMTYIAGKSIFKKTIFAYIFSQSFDNHHECETSTIMMSKWLGMSKSTLIKYIEELSPYVKKVLVKSTTNPAVSFASYKVDMDLVAKTVKAHGNRITKNFNDCQADIYKRIFPKMKAEIDVYFNCLNSWQTWTEMSFNVDMKTKCILNDIHEVIEDIPKDVLSDTEAIKKQFDLVISRLLSTNKLLDKLPPEEVSEMLKKIIKRKQKELGEEDIEDTATDTANTTDNTDKSNDTESDEPDTPDEDNEQSTENSTNTNKEGKTVPFDKLGELARAKQGRPAKHELIKPLPEKPVSGRLTKAQKEENYNINIGLINEFVANYGDNDEELQEVLYRYLTTKFGCKVYPAHFKDMLSDLRKYSFSVSDMISNVELASGKESNILVYPTDGRKSYRRCLKLVDKYVEKWGMTDTTIGTTLYNYVRDVAAPKNKTYDMFRGLLDNLERLCPTPDLKILMVEKAYRNGWGDLVYPNDAELKEQMEVVKANTIVDEDAKMQAIEMYIGQRFFFKEKSYNQVKEAFVSFIQNTDAGKQMNITIFNAQLEFLRLHCLTAQMVIDSLNSAVATNAKDMAKEDYAFTNQIKQSGRTLDEASRNCDHINYSEWKHYFDRHKDSPLYDKFKEAEKIRENELGLHMNN